jgi:hypothetical protein
MSAGFGADEMAEMAKRLNEEFPSEEGEKTCYECAYSAWPTVPRPRELLQSVCSERGEVVSQNSPSCKRFRTPYCTKYLTATGSEAE